MVYNPTIYGSFLITFIFCNHFRRNKIIDFIPSGKFNKLLSKILKIDQHTKHSKKL
jgi:hypothetical protein